MQHRIFNPSSSANRFHCDIGLELAKSIEGVQNVVKYAVREKDVVDTFSPPMEHTELQNPEPPLQPTKQTRHVFTYTIQSFAEACIIFRHGVLRRLDQDPPLS